MRRLLFPVMMALTGLAILPIFLRYAPNTDAGESPALIPPNAVYLDDLYSRINRLRQRRGITPLNRNAALDTAAQNQAEWLVITGMRTHYRPDGSKPSTRASQAGYVSQWCCGENYYLSIDATPDLVWDFWLWSHSHYANMVNRRFDDVGLGMSSNGRRKSYVLVFGDALDSSAPAIPVQPTLQPTPQPTSPPPQLMSSESAALSTGEYVVQPGDTLFHIATQHQTSVEALAAANNIADPTTIYPGQRLVIPGGSAPVQALNPPESKPQPAVVEASSVHVVQPGESLFRIAQRYNVSLDALAQANNIANPSAIDVGQQLVIPSGGGNFSPTGQSSPGGAVAITSPTPGQAVPPQGMPIIGTVQFKPDQGQFYKLEIKGGRFSDWATIGNVHRESLVNSQLEYLSGAPGLEPGRYQLRLVIVDWTGGFLYAPYIVPFVVR